MPVTKNLEDCKNPDGKTYNGVKALQFMFSALTGGKEISEAEIRQMWKEAKEKRDKGKL